MRYYLAFDIGTTAMKCILFDKDFNEAASTSKEYSLIIDSNGMTELDAEKYYSTFCECVGEIISRGYNPKNIKSVTFTTQGETFVCIDEHGKPLARAIVWLDSRAATRRNIYETVSAMPSFIQKRDYGSLTELYRLQR